MYSLLRYGIVRVPVNSVESAEFTGAGKYPIGSTCVLFVATTMNSLQCTCVLFVATTNRVLLQIGSTCVLFVATTMNSLQCTPPIVFRVWPLLQIIGSTCVLFVATTMNSLQCTPPM